MKTLVAIPGAVHHRSTKLNSRPSRNPTAFCYFNLTFEIEFCLLLLINLQMITGFYLLRSYLAQEII